MDTAAKVRNRFLGDEGEGDDGAADGEAKAKRSEEAGETLI